ncbi:MAG: hypothetical protein ACFB22_01990 [Rhodothalassiaceae bacterium]
MPANSKSERPPTADRLRADIDAGRTGDKVAWPDPATVPLGTDAEAGGAAPEASDLARSRQQEQQSGHLDDPPGLGADRAQRWRALALGAAALVAIIFLASLLIGA